MRERGREYTYITHSKTGSDVMSVTSNDQQWNVFKSNDPKKCAGSIDIPTLFVGLNVYFTLSKK